MKIRMLKAVRGSPDGKRVEDYAAGQEVDLSGSEREIDLARVFVREQWAVEIKEEGAPPPAEDAAVAPGVEAEHAGTAPAQAEVAPQPQRHGNRRR